MSKESRSQEALLEQIKRLKAQIEGLTAKREIYFQKLLSERYSAGHLKLTLGVTDLTNDDFHAEIKEWSSVKQAIGQLLSYNFCQKRPNLKLFMFGQKPTQVKLTTIIQLAQSHGIELIHLSSEGTEESLTSSKHIDPYAEYIREYIVEDSDSVIQWAELREHFKSWHTRKNINTILRGRCDSLRHYFSTKLNEYQETTFKNAKLRGFKGYQLKI